MNNLIDRWWDWPVLSLEEYNYIYNNRWWNNNILSLEEYYKIERSVIKNKKIMLLGFLTEPVVGRLYYSSKRK